MSQLLEEREYYKPFVYPWAFEFYKKQQQMHWLPEEVPLQAVSYTHLTLPTKA